MDTLQNVTNESANATNESAIWSPDTSWIPNIWDIFGNIEQKAFETLELWGLSAFHTVFSILMFAAGILVIYFVYVTITSRSSGMFKYIFYGAIALIVLVLLDII